MNKEFDCMEMQRKGAAKLQKKLAGLRIEEELLFWKARNNAFKEEQKRRVKKRKSTTKV